MRAALLHAYSAQNSGDGLLVEASVALLREAFAPEDVEFSLFASDAESFGRFPGRVYCSKPGARGYGSYLRALTSLRGFDLVVGVGGGYLRGSTPVEAGKAALVHWPQLLAARASGTRSIYLPQSIGPIPAPGRPVLRRLLRGVDRVYLRDDRSVAETALRNSRRTPDLALLEPGWRAPGPAAPVGRVVLSARALEGRVPACVEELARRLGEFDGYVQSRVAGNDDRPAMAGLHPVRTLAREELLSRPADAPPRVVVAMRLHAALMALNAGHLVVHLAYERKGFGAFADLGLPEFVHPARRFDPAVVLAQALRLRDDEPARLDYAARVLGARERLARARADLVSEIRTIGGE